MLLETEFILSTGPPPLGQDWNSASTIFEGQDHYFILFEEMVKKYAKI